MSIEFIKPLRKITKIFIHCSASDYKHHDNIDIIKEWHLKRGFSDIGYHYVITKDGIIHTGRNIEKIPAAQKDHNRNAIAICLTGNKNFSQEQMKILKIFCNKINDIYIKKEQGVTFHGHCEVNKNKLCPNFNYSSILNLNKEGRISTNIISNSKIIFKIIQILSGIFILFIKPFNNSNSKS